MTTEYASHTDDQGLTVESNSATAEQLAELATPAPESGQAAAEPEAPGDVDGEAAAEPKLTPFRKGNSPSKDSAARMLQATAKAAEERRLREAAEKRAADLEAQLRARSAPVEPQKAPPAAPQTPQATKFPSYEQWLETHEGGAWDDWQDEKIDWRAEQKLQATEQKREQARLQAEHDQRAQAHLARMATVTTKYPDFQQVRDQADQALAAAGIHAFPEALVQAVIQSDRSDDVIYFLGTHPEEAIQLARDAAAAPVTVAPLLQRMLEGYLAARPAPATGSGAPARSQAKPPVNPVGGTATVQPVSIDEMEFGPEYVRRANKRDQERGKW